MKLLFARITCMSRSSLLSDFYRGRRTVMSVCNVNSLHTGKCLPYRLYIRIVLHHKYPVANAVLRDKIIKRLFLFYPFYNVIDRPIGTICQKNWPCLRIACINVSNAVRLFIRTGIFMLFNNPVLIIINGCTRHNTCLRPAFHCQFINIITAPFVFDKRTVRHLFPEQVVCPFVYFILIHIGSFRKLCLRAVNIQKRIRIATRQLPGFLRIVYIIRKRRNPACLFPAWTNARKWSDISHSYLLSICHIPNVATSYYYSVSNRKRQIIAPYHMLPKYPPPV